MCRESAGCLARAEVATQARSALGRMQRRRRGVEGRRLQRTKSSQWEKWHVRYALLREFANETVILPVRNIVEILDAHDL